ncbi:unnamed protein product [Lampetra planeri]
MARLSQPAPDFSCRALMQDLSFGSVSLAQHRGRYVLLLFYPLDFSFVCPSELTEFSDRAAEFRAAAATSSPRPCDSLYAHFAWVNTPRKAAGLGRVSFPILADSTGAVARAYGAYDEEAGHAYRALFLVDTKGLVRHVTVCDLPIGRSVDETLRQLHAVQFVDKHGDFCPTGWKPGGKHIKNDMKKGLEFFSAEAPSSTSSPSSPSV